MQRKILLFAGLVLALLFLAGCLPFQSADLITTYEIKANMNIKTITQYSGALSAAADTWEVGDCKQKITTMFDQVISVMELSKTMNPNITANEVAQMNKTIDALKAIKTTATCSFQKQDSTGTLTTSFEVSKQLMDDLTEAAGTTGGTAASTGMIEKLSDGTIKAVIPVSKADTTAGLPMPEVTQKEIKIGVEGQLQTLTPSGYVQEGGYYVYKDLTSLFGSSITVKFTPSAGLPFGDLLLPIAVVVIVVLILLAVVIMKRASRPPKAAVTPAQPAIPPTL